MDNVRDEIWRNGTRQLRVAWRDGQTPTTVLLAGASLGVEVWREVLPSLPGRVVAYDRAGMGGTPWEGGLPHLDDVVEDLHAIVQRAGQGQPVVLAAHSMAGFHAEAFTRRYPELVKSVVFVDCSVEFEPLSTDHVLLDRFMGWLQPAYEPILAFFHGKEWRERHPSHSRRAAGAEVAAYNEQANALLEMRQALPWPPIKSVMLTAWAPFFGGGWLAKQAQYAELLGGKQVRIRSGHNMMLDRPEVVLEAIRQARVTG
ncbi:alpha/beta hydrolase [Buchananella hordeovulneris]|uniref:AB hydrolase-1 domain-containing protein n=1 Tax=Buchananella hordeovulneris TaxID=52770 RepID=A0A1Q5PX36_9ACTO|nr:alpha/beta hydrolase [Buchananella hordeovulneris]OKL52066.1 hypothetical protein BSZ40_03885 [Buchananella hordeovulneris]RRD51844.1 alpha/beta hydrolase [Buchananella hordeovulneris]